MNQQRTAVMEARHAIESIGTMAKSAYMNELVGADTDAEGTLLVLSLALRQVVADLGAIEEGSDEAAEVTQ